MSQSESKPFDRNARSISGGAPTSGNSLNFKPSETFDACTAGHRHRQIRSNAKKLGEYCSANPTIGLITATDKLFGDGK
jgi:hypothetical protein